MALHSRLVEYPCLCWRRAYYAQQPTYVAQSNIKLHRNFLHSFLNNNNSCFVVKMKILESVKWFIKNLSKFHYEFAIILHRLNLLLLNLWNNSMMGVLKGVEMRNERGENSRGEASRALFCLPLTTPHNNKPNTWNTLCV